MSDRPPTLDYAPPTPPPRVLPTAGRVLRLMLEAGVGGVLLLLGVIGVSSAAWAKSPLPGLCSAGLAAAGAVVVASAVIGFAQVVRRLVRREA